MSEGFGRFLLALSIRDCPSSQVKLLGAPRRYGSLQSIMAENRSEGRTVHIYDHRNPSEVLGGLILTNGVTNKNLYSMVRTVVTVHGDFDLRHNDDDTIIPDDEAPLQPGNYYIVTEGKLSTSMLSVVMGCLSKIKTARVEASNERPLHRSVSLSSTTRDSGFRDAVRSRDGKCVLTGMAPRNPAAGIGRPLQAAHVFPLAYGEQWLRQGHGRCITNTPRGGERINSVRNGLLLQASAHVLFDTYDFSINPDVTALRSFNFQFLTSNLLHRIITRLCSSPRIRSMLPVPI